MRQRSTITAGIRRLTPPEPTLSPVFRNILVTLIFVYGTLKRGFPLFEKGLQQATFRGTARTVLPYPMMIAKNFYGPVMLDQPGEGLQVLGELFEVEEDRMPVLDKLESVGAPGSFRSTLQVKPIGGGLAQQAVGFMKDESWLDPVHTGYLADYQDRRFIPPWNRD